MRMNQPSAVVWLVSLLLAAASLATKFGLTTKYGMFTILDPWSFWLMGASCGLLLLATLIKGL